MALDSRRYQPVWRRAKYANICVRGTKPKPRAAGSYEDNVMPERLRWRQSNRGWRCRMKWKSMARMATAKRNRSNAAE